MILNYPMLENSTSFFPLHPIFVTFAKCFACLVFDLHFPTKTNTIKSSCFINLNLSYLVIKLL